MESRMLMRCTIFSLIRIYFHKTSAIYPNSKIHLIKKTLIKEFGLVFGIGR